MGGDEVCRGLGDMPAAGAQSSSEGARRLPGSWKWDEERALYIDGSTGETCVDRPYDMCGTFGCLLRDCHPVRVSAPAHLPATAA